MSERVEAVQGKLAGIAEEGVTVFRGVPFAAPPVGPLRFRAPAPAERWQGVRAADRPGPASYQMNGENGARIQAIMATFGDNFPGVRLAPPFAAATYAQPVVSEDCLYLDMWVPDHDPGERLPVFVYYHGGANTGNSASNPLERGARLAREERIIVVRPNYRMGPLGWVHFGLVSDELPEAVNLGVQDQIASLEWVSLNIDRFGGDPGNITICGESAGATAVSHLLVNPRSRRLFRRAILQSLSPFNQWTTQARQDAVSVAELYLQILGIGDIRELLTIDPDRLIAVAQSLQRFFEADKNCAWRPIGGVVDGDIVPHHPAIHLATAEFGGPPFEVMIGFAKDEWQFFRGHSETLRTGTDADFERIFAQVAGADAAAELLRDYRTIHAEHPAPQLISDAMSFEFFKLASLRIAENLSRQNIPTYVFQFSYDLPGQGGYVRAYHTGDMPFIWRNYATEDLARWPAFDGIDGEELARSATGFGKLYGDFIRCGDPGDKWPRYGTPDHDVLWFGQQIEARSGLLAAEMAAFERAGIGDLATLEQRLATNTRSALNSPPRAYSCTRL